MVICLKAAVYLAEDATDKKTDADVNVEVTTTDAAPTNGNDKAVEETPKVEIDVKVDKVDSQATDTRGSRDYGYRGGSSYDGGRGRYGDRSRPMSDDEKLKRYKKQSEERLLDIKRSREAKIGKRRGR